MASRTGDRGSTRMHHVSSFSSSPSAASAAPSGGAIDSDKLAAFAEARKKFAVYGRQNAHVSHLAATSASNTATATTATAPRKRRATAGPGGGTRVRFFAGGDDDEEDASVLKNTLMLQENGELALHLDDITYRLEGILVLPSSDDDGDSSAKREDRWFARAQNVMELARLVQLEQVQVAMRLSRQSRRLYARIRDVILMLRPARAEHEDGYDPRRRSSARVFRLSVAVLAYLLTLASESEEYFTSDVTDLIVERLHRESKEVQDERASAEKKPASDGVPQAAAPAVSPDQHDLTAPLKKTCLKRKKHLARRRSSSSSGDEMGDLTAHASMGKERHLRAQIEALLGDHDAFCIDGELQVSIPDVLAMTLHNLLQMDGPQNQRRQQRSRNRYHYRHRALAGTTFSTVRARKHQLVGNNGLNVLAEVLEQNFQRLQRLFLSNPHASASIESACSLQRVRTILRVLDQASFLETEVQRHMSSQPAVFTILLELIDRLSDLCWGMQGGSKWTCDATLLHLVAEVILVTMRVLINLTHHNKEAAHHVYDRQGMSVLFQSFCKLWGMVEEARRLGDPPQSDSTTAILEEKLVFDAFLMFLSALTNCIECSQENREALTSLSVKDFAGLDAFRESSVCGLLATFFLSKVQSYLRLIELSESRDGRELAAAENDESVQWIPEDVVLGGCSSLLLGCLMKESPSNSAAILAVLPDRSPRLLLRALSAFVALHSQIGALTPEVGKSVLQVEQTLQSFLLQDQPSTSVSLPMSVDITFSAERVETSQHVENEHGAVAAKVSQGKESNGKAGDGDEALTGEGEKVRTPPASAFKLHTWKRVRSTVDLDLESDVGETEQMNPRETPLNSPNVRRQKKESAKRKESKASPGRNTPIASPLKPSPVRGAVREHPKPKQPSPQRLKRARQLVTDLEAEFAKVDSASVALASGLSGFMTSTEDASQHDDDSYRLDFSKGLVSGRSKSAKKTNTATSPSRSRTPSAVKSIARKKARSGKQDPKTLQDRSSVSVAVPTTVSMSLSQQKSAAKSTAKRNGATEEGIVKLVTSFENAHKRKTKAAKSAPLQEDAAGVFDFDA